MDFDSFQKGLSELQGLPSGQVKRALEVAEMLTDEERDDFLKYLKEFNTDFVKADEEERRGIEELEQIVGDAKKEARKIEESAEKESDVNAAEQNLSVPPQA